MQHTRITVAYAHWNFFTFFFISTPFKRLVNKQHIDNKLREGLKHFAAYALSRRICLMDFFLILKLKKKTLGKKLTSLARATSFPGLSPSRPPEREDEDENAQGDELEGALGVSECLLTACHDRQIVDPVQFVERFLRFDTNSSGEIAQKIRSRQVKFAIEQGKHVG